MVLINKLQLYLLFFLIALDVLMGIWMYKAKPNKNITEKILKKL